MPVKNQLRSGSEELEKVVPEMVGWLDVFYRMDVEVGRAVMSVRQLLGLRVGDVVKLDRQASEELLLRVQAMPVASAEVVVGERASTVLVSHIGGEKAKAPNLP